VICYRVPDGGAANTADYQANWAADNRAANGACDGATHQAVLVSDSRSGKSEQSEYDASCQHSIGHVENPSSKRFGSNLLNQ